MSAAQKIALVTGGSRGLGKEMALSLARKGIDVIITYRANEEEASNVVASMQQLGRKAAVLHLDMSRFQDLDQFVNAVKGTLQTVWQSNSFDFLVNNAGMGATVPFEQVTEDLFDEFMNVHFKGVYFLTQKCIPLLNQGEGS
jgi:NAD(P)-dependent dehydrogenase (short-subunit alcohol dehydrogenase family)